MLEKTVELFPKYILDDNWEIYEPIPQPSGLKTASEEEELKNSIRQTRLGIAEPALTTKIKSEDDYDYFKSEIGMNMIVPRGSVDEMRFKVTLKGDSEISNDVIAIDGFPNDQIEDKEITGTIKVGISDGFKLVPVVGDILPNLLKIEINPFEFNIWSMRNVLVDFSDGPTFQPEWYFKKKGLKNNLRVAITIRKSHKIKNVDAEVVAAWIYNPGFFKRVKVETESKKLNII